MMPPVLLALSICLCLVVPVDEGIAIALEPINSTSIQSSKSSITETDRTIIKRSNDPVWFDSTDGTIRPVAQGGSIDVEDRNDSVVGPQKSSPSWWSKLFKKIQDLLTVLFGHWPIWLFISIVALVSMIAYWIFSYMPESQHRRTNSLSRREKEKAKIQDLPFEVEPSMFGLLAQAERYQAAGDFSKAIVYLFSYALVEMDGARCIRLERGKTNRVYLGELRERDNLRNFTSQVILAFEYAFFGKHVLSQESFERIWQQLPAFEAYLKQTVSAQSNVGGDMPSGRT